MCEAVPAEVIIGVDTHKDVHAAAAIDPFGVPLGTKTIPASSKGYQALEAWAVSLGPIRAVGIEGTVDLPPWRGGVRSERHPAARMVIPSMLARASAGVR